MNLNSQSRAREPRFQGGWSLMELVVVLAIIAILAAIITPMVSGYIDRARVSAARNDVRNIVAAIISFNTDTRLWPIYKSPFTNVNGDTYDALESDGEVAILGSGITDWTTGSNGDILALINENLLSLTTSGIRAWNGAYINDITTDPWGTKYYLNAPFLAPGESDTVFVLSAGPDQTIDTAYTQSPEATFAVGGDDIVHRIR